MAEKKAAKPKFERYRTVQGSVGQFISDGFSEIEGLGEEFREICDNTSENLQQTDVYNRRDETASACEGLSEPSINSSILEELDASYSCDMGKTYRGRQTQSRACRASNAASALRAAGESIRAWLEANEELSDTDDTDSASLRARADKLQELEAAGINADDYENAREEADEVADECDSIADEIEGMDWPGMFG
jgi:hypothetical protein